MSDITPNDTLNVISDELEQLRGEVDALDQELIEILVRRFSVTEEIGNVKAKNNLPSEDEQREAKQYKKFKKYADEYGLPREMLKEIFQTVMKFVKLRHSELKESN